MLYSLLVARMSYIANCIRLCRGGFTIIQAVNIPALSSLGNKGGSRPAPTGLPVSATGRLDRGMAEWRDLYIPL